METKPRFHESFQKEGCPDAFPYRQKVHCRACILVLHCACSLGPIAFFGKLHFSTAAVAGIQVPATLCTCLLLCQEQNMYLLSTMPALISGRRFTLHAGVFVFLSFAHCTWLCFANHINVWLRLGKAQLLLLAELDMHAEETRRFVTCFRCQRQKKCVRACQMHFVMLPTPDQVLVLPRVTAYFINETRHLLH